MSQFMIIVSQEWQGSFSELLWHEWGTMEMLQQINDTWDAGDAVDKHFYVSFWGVQNNKMKYV